jgi:hypothetical protein
MHEHSTFCVSMEMANTMDVDQQARARQASLDATSITYYDRHSAPGS